MQTCGTDRNIRRFNQQISGPSHKTHATITTAGDAVSFQLIVQKIRTCNSLLITFTGMRFMIWTLVMSSVLFWSLQCIHAAGYRFPVQRFAIVPLMLLTTSLTSAVLATTQPRRTDNGIIVANSVTLHSGDGEQFDAVFSLDAAQGHRVRILTTRGGWARVKTRHGHIGWLPARDVEQV